MQNKCNSWAFDIVSSVSISNMKKASGILDNHTGLPKCPGYFPAFFLDPSLTSFAELRPFGTQELFSIPAGIKHFR